MNIPANIPVINVSGDMLVMNMCPEIVCRTFMEWYIIGFFTGMIVYHCIIRPLLIKK